MFAPVAENMLKAAYQEYQLQKDLGDLQHQQIQAAIAEQQAAQTSGYDSPRVQRQQLDPLTAAFLARNVGIEGAPQAPSPGANIVDQVKGAARELQLYPDQQQPPQPQQDIGGGRSPQGQFDEQLAQNYQQGFPQEEGTVNDPRVAHMAPYLQELSKRYPGTIDNQGRIHPYIYKKLSDMAEAQAKLEAQANIIAGREVGDLFGLQQKANTKLREQEMENAARIRIQEMKGTVAEKIQRLKNEGFYDTAIIGAFSKEKIAEMKEEGATGRAKLKEAGATERAGIRADTAKDVQGMRNEGLVSVWERRAAIEQAKIAGRADLALKIQEGKALSAKEITELKEAGANKRKRMDIESAQKIEKDATKAGKYKKYPPSNRGFAPNRPQGYRETSVEKSLRQSIANKEKLIADRNKQIPFQGRKGKEKIEQDNIQTQNEIEAMRAQLSQIAGGGEVQSTVKSLSGLEAQPPAKKGFVPPPDAPKMYFDWLKQHSMQPSLDNWKQFKTFPKGK